MNDQDRAKLDGQVTDLFHEWCSEQRSNIDVDGFFLAVVELICAVAEERDKENADLKAIMVQHIDSKGKSLCNQAFENLEMLKNEEIADLQAKLRIAERMRAKAEFDNIHGHFTIGGRCMACLEYNLLQDDPRHTWTDQDWIEQAQAGKEEGCKS